MSREIKFRAWTGTKIVYRFAIEAISGFQKDAGIAAEITNGEISEYHSDWILMQYTGLKDKNGREIYEGDIIRALAYGKPFSYVLEWQQEGELNGYPITGFIYNSLNDADVIGNIYENPELIT